MFERMRKILGRRPTQAATEPGGPRDVTYSSDQPIARRADDRFNRAPFASRIATTIASRMDPASLVVGLYGPWGDGKTSVLEMMREELVSNAHVVVVTFNPWHFPSQEALIRGFFDTLSVALGKSLPTLRERIGEVMADYGSILSPVGGGDVAQGLGKTLATVDLTELKSRLEGFLRDSGKRVVVLIDDIDRLDRVETQAIFKLVKLSAGFRHTAYVLAFDDAVVAAALGERYGPGGAEAGRAFLEKIIQVPLRLPPAEEISLRQLAFQGADESLQLAGIDLPPSEGSRFANLFVLGLQPRLTTPRLAKLYANALIFALPILKGEVDPVDQMLLEGIRVFHPKLYTAIASHSELFLGSSAEEKNRHGEADPLETLLANCLGHLTEREGVLVRRFLARLFPRTGTAHYGGEWEQIWERGKRLTSARYFWRYLLYGMPGGDVADGEVSQVLALLIVEDAEAAKATFVGLAERRQFPTLVRKLRERASELDEATAEGLALSLARHARHMPREKGMLSVGGSFEQAAILVSELVGRLPQGERRKGLAQGVIELADPLGFGAACLRWLRHDTSRSEEERLLPTELETELETALAERSRESAAREPLYLSEPEDASALHYLWDARLGRESLQVALVRQFTNRPSDVDAFLASYLGSAWSMETGESMRASFDRDNYDRVARVVDSELIAENLRARYDIQEPEHYQGQDVPIGRALANQFLFVHRRATQLAAPAAEPEVEE